MRKLFWACTTCGILLVAGVISTAHFAVHHPTSVVGRVLTGASYAAAFVNPIGGLAPVLAHTHAGSATAVEEVGEPVPLDPTPDDGPVEVVPPLPGVSMDDSLKCNPAAPGPIVVPSSSAPIVIPEDNPAVASTPVPSGPFCPGAECPSSLAAAPASMSYCSDEEESEELPMPSEEAELLPMPRVDNPEAGCMGLDKEPMLDLIQRCVHEQLGGNRDAIDRIPVVKPTELPAETLERGSPSNAPSDPGSEEASEAVHKAALEKIHLLTPLPGDDERNPKHSDVDTMEYRSSDGHLYDYGHDPL